VQEMEAEWLKLFRRQQHVHTQERLIDSLATPCYRYPPASHDQVNSLTTLNFCYRDRWWGPAALVVDVRLVFSIQRRDVAFSNVNFIRSHCRCV